MQMVRLWKRLDAILGRTASIFYGFGSGILAVLMVFTFVDVALRYFFSSPIRGDYELSSYLMALVIPSGLALTALRQRHIRVDVFTRLLPGRVQSALTTFAHALSLVFVCFIVWQTAKFAELLIESGETALNLPIPKYPFVIVCTIYFIVFALVILRDLIISVRTTVLGRKEGDTDVAS